MSNKKIKTIELHIKNMTSTCCVRLLDIIFRENDITVNSLRLGYANVNYDYTKISKNKIIEIINTEGFEVIKSREEQIVEQTKIAVIELIHEMGNSNSIAQKAEYIVEKLGLNYRYLSKLFSKHEPLTLERYIILNKIEKIKRLIDGNEYTLSEIAYMMDYNSVQYLSNQFKKETNMTLSEYKDSDGSSKKALLDLY